MLQPDDVVTFRPLKKQFQAVKSALIIYQAMTHQVLVIKGEHMLRLLKHPWEVAFCKENMRETWKVTGYTPFNC